MAFSKGSGKMAVMARLLEASSFSPNVAEEISHQKLAAQNLYRELCEADEPNLLDKEDMHVFGLKPMTDPLHLVCCNACKKPITASQYTAHAELCRSLNTTEESILDVHGGTGHRKPPRKDRKKLPTVNANQATPVREQERSDSINVDDTLSMSMDVKRNSVCIDTASVMDGSGVTLENKNHSACVMPPAAKRSKLIAGEHVVLSGNTETAYGVTKILSTEDAHTCTDFQKQTIPGREMPNDGVVCKNPSQVHERCFQAQDIPVPIATKIYYTQRNNRLKSALSHLYEASMKEFCNDVVIPQVSKLNIVPLQNLAQECSSYEQVDDVLNKKLEVSVQTPDQILALSSEVYLGKSGGCLPAANISNQFQVDNVLRPQTAPVGLTRSKYHSKAYSFASNSGKLMGTIQQPNGSVPVV